MDSLDMKNYRADAFRIMPPETAGYVLLCLVLLLCILEPIL